MLKRSIDITLSSVGLIVLFPALLVIAMCILIADGRPIFYRGVRVGRLGKVFRVFKFRTMVTDAERLGGSATADTDTRITRIGRVLRRHKLDEVPQLINVLRGEMSLVGPRPEVPEYMELLSEAEKPILTVRPGITDWASLWDADEGALLARSSQPERLYLDFVRPEKVKLQLEYVRRQSLCTDLLILCKTAYVIMVKPSPPSFAALDRYASALVQGTGSIADGKFSERSHLENEQGAAPVSDRRHE
jgi:lipopolysaccharide/colanic/teichoic acid biosynthesis glycosyltransferase